MYFKRSWYLGNCIVGPSEDHVSLIYSCPNKEMDIWKRINSMYFIIHLQDLHIRVHKNLPCTVLFYFYGSIRVRHKQDSFFTEGALRSNRSVNTKDNEFTLWLMCYCYLLELGKKFRRTSLKQITFQGNMVEEPN